MQDESTKTKSHLVEFGGRRKTQCLKDESTETESHLVEFGGRRKTQNLEEEGKRNDYKMS